MVTAEPSDTTRITVEFTDVYDGVEHTRTEPIDVTAPPPSDIDDPAAYEEWADENLRPHTGDGHAANKDAGYFTKITAAPTHPHIVGLQFEWGV